jgi:hypothetical protein
MNVKTFQEILLIKEKYGIADNDPIFALLDTYGCLQIDIVNSIDMLKEAQKIVHNSLKEIAQKEITIEDIIEDGRVAALEQGIKIGGILSEDMQNKLKELFLSIDIYRVAIEEEREELRFDRTTNQHSLENLFQRYIKEKESQNKKNKISFGLITCLILIQSISIIALYNAIS